MMEAGEQREEGRFAGAVVAHDADHLVRIEVQADAVHGADRSEGLDHVVDGKKRGPRRLSPEGRPCVVCLKSHLAAVTLKACEEP